MNIKKILSPLLIISLLFITSACNQNTVEIVEKGKIDRFIVKEIQNTSIFDLNQEHANISYTKKTTAYSNQTVNINAQISGKLQNLNVEIGDYVFEGDLIATLGGSLATDVNNVQLDTAKELEKINNISKNLTEQSSTININSAKTGAKTALESYNNSLQSLENSKNIYYEQLDGAEIAEELAENGYDRAKEVYYEALHNLESIENSNDYVSIAQAEAQVAAAKIAKENSKLSLEQAGNGIDQIQKGFNSQEDQLEFAIQSSYNQYQIALNQLQSSETGQLQQLNGLDAQIAQSDSSKKISELNQKYSRITAPISGTITKVFIDENNLVNPGQIIATVEETSNIILKTSLNENEVRLIKQGDKVDIIGDKRTLTGTVLHISPTINPNTKKIDIEISAPKDSKIPAGILMTVKFYSSANDRLFIPLNSIFIIDNIKNVKIVSDTNFIRYKQVQVGIIIGDYIEILSGLNGDERLITSTTTFLSEGDLIAIK